MNSNFFSHARTALKIGLLSLGIKQNDKILVPSYICEAVIQPIRDLKLQLEFYDLDDSFQPIWSELKDKIAKDHFSSLLMNHYFGIPQDIHKFTKIAKDNNLILVEDNSHGFGGKFEDKFLGSYGDVGISSPRKILNLSSGGILYLNSKLTKPNNLPVKKALFFENYLRGFLSNNPSFKIFFDNLRNKRNFSDPRKYLERKYSDMATDKYSELRILKYLGNDYISEVQRKQYLRWIRCREILKKEGFQPAIDSISNTSSPWLFPLKIDNFDEKNRLIKFAKKKNLILTTWPILPVEALEHSGNALNKWKNNLFIHLNYKIY